MGVRIANHDHQVVQEKELCVLLFWGGAGRAKIDCVHRDGLQEIPGREWMGYAQLLYDAAFGSSCHTAATAYSARKFVTTPYASNGKRLHIHELPAKLTRWCGDQYWVVPLAGVFPYQS
jgi:hypothetical protein